MTISWNFVRSKFPALKNATYLATAAVGPISNAVYLAQKEHLEMMHHQGDIFYQKSLETMESCRSKVAKLLHCEAEEVAFGVNTSTNMSLLSQLFAGSEKRKILSFYDEFPSTVIPWEQQGFEVDKIKVEKGSTIDLAQIEKNLSSSVAAVVLSHQQFAMGYRAPLQEIGELLKEKNIPFIVNATQSLGMFPIDVKKSHITALTASCHKWMGAGYGISICYLAKEFNHLLENLKFSGWLSVEDLSQMSHEEYTLKKNISRIEVGVPNFNTIIGLDASVTEILKITSEEISKRILDLGWYFLKACEKQGVSLVSYTPQTREEYYNNGCGTFLVAVDSLDDAHEYFLKHKIYVTTRQGAIRVSMSYFNNESDLDSFLHFYREFSNTRTS